MKRHLVVLAPGRPPSGELEAGITALLRRADQHARPSQDECDLFGDLFPRTPDTWPAAALTRQYDAGDAGRHVWLRADPAHFRVEPGNVRLMACGDLGQDAHETEALVRSLAPLFGEEGFELSAPHPQRWYLRSLYGDAPEFPALPAAMAALGGDLFELWPEDDVHRRWRRLFSEAQIVLAAHPINRQRSEVGRPAINGLWFWGAGRLPDQVRAPGLSAVVSEDPLLLAWAGAAGVSVQPIWPERSERAGITVLDLRSGLSDEVELRHLLEDCRTGRVAELDWRAPGAWWRWKRRHRWRFWR